MSTERRDAARAVTILELQAMKARGERIAALTAYDYLFARIVDQGGADVVLVGDSVADVVLGLDSTLPITLEDMIHHARAVRRGVARALLVVDMPFLSYGVSVEEGVRNAGRLLKETGANAVKVEGGSPELAATVAAMVRVGIPVMGHLGFTPQSVLAIGGYRIQGRRPDDAARILDEARRLEDAGVFAIVLELLPAELAARVTQSVSVPTIGIGAGPACDGQVLVLYDLLGLNDRFRPKFLKRYAALSDSVRAAVGQFRDDVRGGVYPGAEHSF